MVLVARDSVGLYTITSDDERTPGHQISENQLLEFYSKGRTLTGNRVIALFRNRRSYSEFLVSVKNGLANQIPSRVPSIDFGGIPVNESEHDRLQRLGEVDCGRE